MARSFNGSTDSVHLAVGGLPAMQAATFAAIVRKSSDTGAFEVMFGAGSSPTNAWAFYLNGSNKLSVWNGTAEITSTFTVIASESWVFLAASRAAGTSTLRFHKYVYSTNAWTHTNTGDGTSGDSPAPAVAADLGVYTGGGNWAGDIASAAMWAATLGDTQIESLPFTLQPWFQVQPVGLWLLDQSATGQKIDDLSGGGAHETALNGTTVASTSVPVFNTTDGVCMPTFPSAGAAVSAPPPVKFNPIPFMGRR